MKKKIIISLIYLIGIIYIIFIVDLVNINVIYKDGSKQNIKDALKDKIVTMEELESAGYRFLKNKKWNMQKDN